MGGRGWGGDEGGLSLSLSVTAVECLNFTPHDPLSPDFAPQLSFNTQDMRQIKREMLYLIVLLTKQKIIFHLCRDMDVFKGMIQRPIC